jgi:protein O-mannosyl-transferase
VTPANQRHRTGKPAARARTPDAAASPVRLLVALAAFVAVVVLLVHWPALSARALSFDDNQYLTENPLVRNPGWNSAGRFLGEVLRPSTVRGYYQPLAMISLMLDCAMGGSPSDLRPFHRTSLALHVVNTVLVIVFIYMLFGEPWAAAIVGLLFGVHPLAVEPIPWVGERKTLLTTCFSLGCLILYVRYARSGGRKVYGGAIAAYVLALMSKPTSTPLPVLLLLLDYWPLGRLNRRAVVEKIPFLAIAVVSSIVTYVSQAQTASVARPAGYALSVVPLTLCHNIIFYLHKIFWPANLSAHYPYPLPFTIGQPAVLAGVIGTCILIPLLLFSLRWTRALAVGWAFFFVAIFPTMGVVGFTHSIASDKYAYLPSIGLLLTLGWLLSRGFTKDDPRATLTRRQMVLAGLILIAVTAEIVVSRRALANWQDTEGHFRHMLCLTPDSRVVQFGLADALRHRAQANRSAGLFAEALEHYRKSVRPGPDSPFGRNDLLTCAALNNIGNTLAQQGKLDEAIACWREVLRLNPLDANAHNNLGIALAWKGQIDEAIHHYTEALRIDPSAPETHNNLGLELERKGQLDQAARQYDEALGLRPDYTLARRNLAAALAAAGRFDRAIEEYGRLLRSQPMDADVHYRLGLLWSRKGQSDRAVQEYRQALHIDPRHAEARRWLDEAGK